jgi:hypothetical protein
MGAHCVSLRDERDGKSGETKRSIEHGAKGKRAGSEQKSEVRDQTSEDRIG